MTRPGSPGENADAQPQSNFFRLPREIRDMIYVHFWEVSGPRQHVFQREAGRGLTHYACARPREGGWHDSRNDEFEEFWRRAQPEDRGAAGEAGLRASRMWARRISSTWNEHWCCEEAMLEAEEGQEGNREKTERSAFLPSLLTCKRMYNEALPSLYSRTTFILTTLPASHRFLVTNPSPHLARLRSIELSLNVPYAALHNLSGPSLPCKSLSRQDGRGSSRSFGGKPSTPRPNDWEDICAALSDLCEPGGGGSSSSALRDVAIRLDLAEDDRYWWEVRESRALSAVRDPLRSRAALQLPDLTVDVERMRSFQYRASSGPGGDGAGEGEGEGEGDGVRGPGAQGPDDSFLVYPLPSYLRSSLGGSRRLDPDFKSLERYSRRRWTRPRGGGDHLEPRVEFFTPRWQAMAGPDVVISKLDGLFRGMLMS